jgi:hypothetical protein
MLHSTYPSLHLPFAHSRKRDVATDAFQQYRLIDSLPSVIPIVLKRFDAVSVPPVPPVRGERVGSAAAAAAGSVRLVKRRLPVDIPPVLDIRLEVRS